MKNRWSTVFPKACSTTHIITYCLLSQSFSCLLHCVSLLILYVFCHLADRYSGWGFSSAWHQTPQQSLCVQRLLQCAALRTGLAAEGGHVGPGLPQFCAERRLRQWGGGGVPRTRLQTAQGQSTTYISTWSPVMWLSSFISDLVYVHFFLVFIIYLLITAVVYYENFTAVFLIIFEIMILKHQHWIN